MVDHVFVGAAVGTPGGEITWTNQDDIAHTVTFVGRGPDGSAASHRVPPGQRLVLALLHPGRYEYFSRTDPSMRGVVVVGLNENW